MDDGEGKEEGVLSDPRSGSGFGGSDVMCYDGGAGAGEGVHSLRAHGDIHLSIALSVVIV